MVRPRRPFSIRCGVVEGAAGARPLAAVLDLVRAGALGAVEELPVLRSRWACRRLPLWRSAWLVPWPPSRSCRCSSLGGRSRSGVVEGAGGGRPRVLDLVRAGALAAVEELAVVVPACSIWCGLAAVEVPVRGSDGRGRAPCHCGARRAGALAAVEGAAGARPRPAVLDPEDLAVLVPACSIWCGVVKGTVRGLGPGGELPVRVPWRAVLDLVRAGAHTWPPWRSCGCASPAGRARSGGSGGWLSLRARSGAASSRELPVRGPDGSGRAPCHCGARRGWRPGRPCSI